jgi:2-polyprenyl-3-methyl-5-hydroxy-6-metoxy-1,4-benzoquinol methylase
MDPKSHWESVYGARPANAVSWFQPRAERSLALIQRVAPDLDLPIIDVGGGASMLVDELVRGGHRDITVLDLASTGLAVAQARLGTAAATVRWLEGDVRSVPLPPAHYAVWHDRAVFHFLTEAADRAAYVRQVEHTVKPGGFVLVATFAEDGPTHCSGLPVARYSADALHDEFGAEFQLLSSEREIHHTPMGKEQAFIYCLCRLGPAESRSPAHRDS